MNIKPHIDQILEKEQQIKKYENADVTSADVIEHVVGGGAITDINKKFKDTMPGFMAKLNSHYINTNNKFRGVVYRTSYQLGKFSADADVSVREIINGLKVATGMAYAKYNEAERVVSLIGQKYRVLQSGVKLESELKASGIDFKNVLAKDYKNIDAQEVSKALERQMLKFDIEVDKNIDIALLEEPHVSDKVRQDIVEKVIWPKIKDYTRETISLINVTAQLHHQSKYYKQLEHFARNNGITIESAVFLIQQKPELYQDLKGADKIQKVSTEIIAEWNKYTDFTNAGLYVVKFYLNVADKVLNKYLPEDKNRQIREEKFYFNSGQDLNLNDVVKSFLDIGLAEKISQYRDKKPVETLSR